MGDEEVRDRKGRGRGERDKGRGFGWERGSREGRKRETRGE